MWFTRVITVLSLISLTACNTMMAPMANTGGTANTGGSVQPRPAFKDTALGMTTISSLIVVMELKRQKTQDSLKASANPQDISKFQSRLTAIDAIKGNLVNYYNDGRLSVADRLALVTASADIAKSKLPDYGDVIGTLSTLSQILINAQAQAQAEVNQQAGKK